MRVIAVVSTMSEYIILEIVGPFYSDSDITCYLSAQGFTERSRANVYLDAYRTKKAVVMPLVAP